MSKARTPEPRKILIVDDHPIMRTGVRQMIAQEPDLAICGEAEDAHGALEAIGQSAPDVAVVDISLKDSSGIELIKDIRIRFPHLPVLVLTMHKESFYAERVLRAGARGYLTKDEAPTRIVEGIRAVLAGQIFISDQLASKVLAKLVDGSGGLLVDKLSDREFEVFQLIGKGLEKHEIARQLSLSVKTIDAHRENIKKKLNLETSTDLLRYAIQWVQFETTP
jgi:DNA-binding NarL/FixJ family response regulator